MPTKRDYYEVLGVSKTAGADELKAAYRKAALQHHPDRNPGNKAAEEKFKEVNEAYEVLSAPEKRRLYDQFGHAGVQQGGGPGGPGGFHGFEDMAGGGFGDVFSDLFGDIFGGGGGGGRGQGRRGGRGADLRYDHTVTLHEAFTGTQSSLHVARRTTCSKCNGSGAKPGTSRRTCSECRGAGQVRVTRGFFTLAQTCPRCRGEGQIVESPCSECRGEGRVRSTDNLTVRIPPGVEDGTALRVPGAGEAGERGTPAGDLYVVVHITPDSRFERDGENLLTDRHVSIAMAALGGEVEIPTVEKSVRINIPAGTQSGTLLRVRGAGMPRLKGSGRGDVIVRVVVDVPTRLNKEQKRLLAELAQSMGEEGVSTDDGLFKKVFGR
ncbi:MAG TPA: molecular chaperone DnaJ [Elusimicrobiota bacterium]|nr:molecular chaperone DnaJ [Elusimicrobiota bacterium]